MSDIAAVRALEAQRDLFYAARDSARALGHTVEWQREPDYTIGLWCTQCGVRSDFPVALSPTVPTLPNIYCPRRCGVTDVRRAYWFHETEHRVDVAHCLCDACVAASSAVRA